MKENLIKGNIPSVNGWETVRAAWGLNLLRTGDTDHHRIQIAPGLGQISYFRFDKKSPTARERFVLEGVREVNNEDKEKLIARSQEGSFVLFLNGASLEFRDEENTVFSKKF